MKEACCINCKHFTKIMSSPIVDQKPMTNKISNGCLVFKMADEQIVVLCNEDGLCEEYIERKLNE